MNATRERRAERGAIVAALRGVEQVEGSCVSMVRARRSDSCGVTRRARTMPHSLVAAPSAVVSMTEKSRRENCRQQRNRVASLRGGRQTERGWLPCENRWLR